jgi:hypothetical protein
MNYQTTSSPSSAMSTDIGGHASSRLTVCYMLSVLLLTYCVATLPNVPSILFRCLPLSLLPLFDTLFTMFSTFTLLKLCSMSVNCFLFSSKMVLFSHLHVLGCPQQFVSIMVPSTFFYKPHLCCLQLGFDSLIHCPSFTTIIMYCSNTCL